MKILKFILMYIICSIVGAIGLMIYAFPMWPKTLIGWVLLLILGLPVILLGEAIGGFLTDNKISRSIESDEANKNISIKRMIYLFISLGTIFLIAILVSYKLESSFIGEFITTNFKV